MALASGEATTARRSVTPYVAYAVVLALLGGAGATFWAGRKSELPTPSKSSAASPTAERAASAEPPAPVAAAPAPAPQGLKLPPRPAAAPDAQKPVPTAAAAPAPAPAAPPAPVPIPAAAPSATAEKPVPPKSKCTVDGSWPAERTEQGKAIQGMLRDLGLYEGTVYGTVGPTTRAAIRKFQVSAGQPETGEPDEALFDSLKKKCIAP